MRGYTQQALARASGLSQSAIASYENGNRESSRSLRRLAHALDVELEWLETGKGPMDRSSCNYELRDPAYPDTNTYSSLKRWPFVSVPFERYDSLTAHNKRQLEQIVRLFIDTCHAEYTAATHKSRRNR